MKTRIHTRTTCRLCGADNLRRFLHLPNLPFTDEFVTAEQRGREFAADLDVFFCPACRSAQTLHDVEAHDYYRAYGYTVSASPFAQQFMTRLAEATRDRFALQPGDNVLEVGSGDGFQLACFQQLEANVLGFEPSDVLCEASQARGVPVQPGLFTAETAGKVPAELRPAHVMLLAYTFDHLPEPRAFLDAVRPLLDPQRGVLIIEVHDLEQIIARRETCLFEHEHTIYLHRGSMRRLLEQAGFKLLTADLLPATQRRGNSLLIAAAPQTTIHAADERATAGERNPLDDWPVYAEFAAQAEQSFERLRAHVGTQRAQGRRVAGYGAGGRGVMTLAMAGLTAADVAFLCDRNTGCHGRYTPVTHIPVVPPEQLATEPIDEVVVFSYGYMDEIRAAGRAVEERGGRFVSLLDLLQ